MTCRSLLGTAFALIAFCISAEGQQSVPDWQIKAGGKMSFDVASIRLDTVGNFNPLDITPEDTFVPTGGRFIAAGLSLVDYIAFAYKIWLTPSQRHALVAGLPKWAGTDKFVIEARAPTDHPTKDQLRLMMQTLLADRFHLALHFESHELPVFAFKLDKPGKPGPQLRPHAQDLPCDKTEPIPADRHHFTPEMIPCHSPIALDMPDKERFIGFRDASLDLFAYYLPLIGMGDRPFVNQTGLAGTFDIAIVVAGRRSASEETGAEPDMPGVTLLQAFKDQLGLKLESTRSIIQTPVINHVEQPSEN